MSKSLELALEWARVGWPVFPLRPNKRPWFADWNTEATTAPGTIRKWWENDQGDWLVGIVPAMADPICFVLDIDVKDGKDGNASLAAIATDWDPGIYPSQTTKSGGRHLFMGGAAPTSAGTLGVGLDTRGGLEDGTSRGYVVAYGPPPAEPADVPPGPAFSWGAREKVAGDRHTPIVEYDLPTNLKRAEAYMAAIEAAGEGERNAALFKHVASIKDLGVSMAMAFELIERYPAALGDPPSEDVKEIQATVRSAYDNGQAPPGQHAVNPAALAQLVSEEAARPQVSEGKALQSARKHDTDGAPRKRVRMWPELELAPPPTWIVKGLIPDNALVGLFGQGGSYKSFIALDLALNVATSQLEWAGREIRKPGPVVIVQGEGTVQSRALVWQKHRMPIGDRLAVIEGMDLSSAEDTEDVAKQIKAAQDDVWFAPPRLIIIDTLARASGGADENSSRDMGKVVAHCDALRRSFGCTVLLVHHTPKSNNSWRGSTAVLFALDTALAVEKQGDLRATIEVSRQKDGEIGGEYKVEFEIQETGRLVDDDPETSLLMSKVEEVKPEIKREKTKAKAKAVKEVEQRESMIGLARELKIADVLDGLPDGTTLGPSELAKMMVADTSEYHDGMRSWLKRQAKKGLLDKYIATRDPLTFRHVAKEKAPAEAEALPQ